MRADSWRNLSQRAPQSGQLIFQAFQIWLQLLSYIGVAYFIPQAFAIKDDKPLTNVDVQCLGIEISRYGSRVVNPQSTPSSESNQYREFIRARQFMQITDSSFESSAVEAKVNRSRRLLIVEDDMIAATYLQEMLTRLGYCVIGIAESGEQALSLIAASVPDLILMDIQIKGDFDGIETAKRVPDDLGIPIIYISAHSDDPTLNRAGATTPSGFLIKPVQERLLHANIITALIRSSGARSKDRRPQHLRDFVFSC